MPITLDLELWLYIGLILFWLRATIDQRKGSVVEVLAVTLPIGLLAGRYYVERPDLGLVELGFYLTPGIAFIFLCLPSVALVRFCERLWRGEQPRLSDMFRLTTLTALGTFVLNLLRVDLQVVANVTTLTLAYLSGDVICKRSRMPARLGWLALAAVACWAVSNLISIIDWGTSNRYVDYLMEPRSGLVMGLVFAPLVWHLLLDRNICLQYLGYWAHCLQLRYLKPREAISLASLFRLWRFREEVCYLNHGSFGAVPELIRRQQRDWQEQVADEPMDMLARKTQPAWQAANRYVAQWLGCSHQHLALCENATVGMNEIAGWFPLQAGDEVLLSDHEYGAVKRIWERRATRAGAVLKYVKLPLPLKSPQEIIDAFLAACTTRTRLAVFSHITSPTAILLPVAGLCQALREREIATCVDGPHALLQERVHLTELACDFYTASCHKWLCAPLGSGLVYVHPRWQEQVEPLRLSWGLLPPDSPQSWTDEMNWIGTRDYSPYMAIASAIDYFSNFDYQRMDERNHQLACYARNVISESLMTEPLTPESREWFGWMVGIWLPNAGPRGGDHSTLQQRLWQRHHIEVPIMRFADRYLVRVSCHLYNTTHDIDLLARKLIEEINRK